MKDERVYLGHIRDAINDIEEYTAVGLDPFMAERMRQDAVKPSSSQITTSCLVAQSRLACLPKANMAELRTPSTTCG